MRMGRLFMFEGLIALSFLWPQPPADEVLSAEPHSGVFFVSFETSLFEPCDSAERWWLGAPGGINKPFWERAKELRAEHESATGEELGYGSPPYFLTAKGRVTERGEHGHLGQYNRQFDVAEFTEFQLATAEDLERCMTSGFFETGVEVK